MKNNNVVQPNISIDISGDDIIVARSTEQVARDDSVARIAAERASILESGDGDIADRVRLIELQLAELLGVEPPPRQ